MTRKKTVNGQTRQKKSRNVVKKTSLEIRLLLQSSSLLTDIDVRVSKKKSRDSKNKKNETKDSESRTSEKNSKHFNQLVN